MFLNCSYNNIFNKKRKMGISNILVNPASRKNLRDAIIWATPALGIPTLRFFQDPPETRKKMFIRDFGTYTVGAATFILTNILTTKTLNKVLKDNIKNRDIKIDFIALGIALLANILYAGIGAVKVSERFSKNKNNISNNSTLTQEIIQKKFYKNA